MDSRDKVKETSDCKKLILLFRSHSDLPSMRQRRWQSRIYNPKNKADVLRRPLSTQTTKRTYLLRLLTRWRTQEQPCCILPTNYIE